ncbi:helix-turn-helix domain-containing protein [Paenibacillus aurantius]|uniref:Helix-turn-helix domain-containing protein n=1 Tax=Paenibacillus aurantius TaxID=2918900 RepID=A0AA96RIX8_9BACL|nr:helix-turn-helix domain-containing protein [Paenibacillus aurantius]WNQ12659.1 helix-turn-helix domain-containing protein [Paenibacillus aurantius]
MDCLELAIPPLPQFLTVGHGYWPVGMKHACRMFRVYDLLVVAGGCLYMTEEGKEYELREGDMLLLEPGRQHWGHRPVDEITEIYWVHFLHSDPVRRLPAGDVPWSRLLPQDTDRDLTPTPQYLYLPKHGKVQLAVLRPLLERMVELHRAFSLGSAVSLHAHLAEFFVRLQGAARGGQGSRSQLISEKAVDYLRRHAGEPFQAKRMEEELHFQFDYLSRCLKKHTGLSPLQYLNRLRIGRANELLENTDLTIQEIGDRVGVGNGNYFIRLYRRLTGMTPGEFRQSRQGRV